MEHQARCVDVVSALTRMHFKNFENRSVAIPLHSRKVLGLYGKEATSQFFQISFEVFHIL